MHGFHLVCMDPNAVVLEEQASHCKGDALVPVDERVVSRESRSVGGRQREEVRLSVGEAIAGGRERGIEQPGIADARRAAM